MIDLIIDLMIGHGHQQGHPKTSRYHVLFPNDFF